MPEHRKGGHRRSIKGKTLVHLPRVPAVNGATYWGVVLGESLREAKTPMLSISRSKAVGSEEDRSLSVPWLLFQVLLWSVELRHESHCLAACPPVVVLGVFPYSLCGTTNIRRTIGTAEIILRTFLRGN